MKTKIGIASLLVAVIAAGAHLGWSSVSAQANDELLPNCGIPKSYGRLVSVLPGAGGGAAGAAAQAIFEAEDGTVRWVSMVQGGINQTPASRTSAVRPAFLPAYQCALSNEWKRH